MPPMLIKTYWFLTKPVKTFRNPPRCTFPFSAHIRSSLRVSVGFVGYSGFQRVLEGFSWFQWKTAKDCLRPPKTSKDWQRLPMTTDGRRWPPMTFCMLPMLMKTYWFLTKPVKTICKPPRCTFSAHIRSSLRVSVGYCGLQWFSEGFGGF